jgi:hypothetical protein
MKKKKPVRTAKSYEREIEELKRRHAEEKIIWDQYHARALDNIHTLEQELKTLTIKLTVAQGSETSLRLKLTKSREELDRLQNLPRDELKRVQIFQEIGQALEILGLVRGRLNGEDLRGAKSP